MHCAPLLAEFSLQASFFEMHDISKLGVQIDLDEANKKGVSWRDYSLLAGFSKLDASFMWKFEPLLEVDVARRLDC